MDDETRKNLVSAELALQRKLQVKTDKIDDFKKGLFGSPELIVFAWQKMGSPYLQLLHSASEFHVLGGVST